MFETFLAPSDADRAARTLQMLFQHATHDWILTGGLAVELHLHRARGNPACRILNDIDFIVDRFATIPDSLASDLIFRHVHPREPVNKTLLQAVFPLTAVRIDVFRATPGAVERSLPMPSAIGMLPLISVEDLTARSARLSLDLAEGQTMPAKHARDFLRLLPFVDAKQMEIVWPDHRKPQHPATFSEASELLQQLIPARTDLQIVLNYSHDCESKCPRCDEGTAFALAAPEQVLALLGYC